MKLEFNDEYDERVQDKGHSGDAASVILEDGRRVPVWFISTLRLMQILDSREAQGMPYFAEPKMIIIPDVTWELMERAIEGLKDESYFK
ncbi:MAG TPA: hypothetical protein VLC09_21220 [Polyangiaceae bacterium]|nr:hypothetical protein [Polyangiaceae bacterium]